MNENLTAEENIIDYKILNTTIEENKVIVSMFFTVYENITDYSKIEVNDVLQ